MLAKGFQNPFLLQKNTPFPGLLKNAGRRKSDEQQRLLNRLFIFITESDILQGKIRKKLAGIPAFLYNKEKMQDVNHKLEGI